MNFIFLIWHLTAIYFAYDYEEKDVGNLIQELMFSLRFTGICNIHLSMVNYQKCTYDLMARSIGEKHLIYFLLPSSSR